jgi:5-methylcytosine-specific restriction endonuclease McrA
MTYYSFSPTCHHISTVEQKSSFPSIGRDSLLPVVAAEHRPGSSRCTGPRTPSLAPARVVMAAPRPPLAPARPLEKHDTATAKERHTKYYERSKAIKLYALARANGVCEGCGNPAPFVRQEGTPYLEVHHIRKLADGGPDDPRWVIALCPNCHRRAHYRIDASEFNVRLTEDVGGFEGE